MTKRHLDEASFPSSVVASPCGSCAPFRSLNTDCVRPGHSRDKTDRRMVCAISRGRHLIQWVVCIRWRMSLRAARVSTAYRRLGRATTRECFVLYEPAQLCWKGLDHCIFIGQPTHEQCSADAVVVRQCCIANELTAFSAFFERKRMCKHTSGKCQCHETNRETKFSHFLSPGRFARDSILWAGFRFMHDSPVRVAPASMGGS